MKMVSVVKAPQNFGASEPHGAIGQEQPHENIFFGSKTLILYDTYILWKAKKI